MKRILFTAAAAVLLFNCCAYADVIRAPQYSGAQVINGKVYAYDANGELRVGWEDGKYYNEYGFPAEGFLEINGAKYCFVNGEPLKGLQKISNDYYYFNSQGIMCKGTVVEGYSFDHNGIGQPVSEAYKELDSRVAEILKTTGTDIKPIFDYCVKHIKYKYTDEKDWTEMALEALKTGRGACYHRAALLDFMLKKAGYKTRVIWRKGTGSQQHYWNQVYVNGVWTNLDVGYNKYMVSDQQLKNSGWVFSEIKNIIYK